MAEHWKLRQLLISKCNVKFFVEQFFHFKFLNLEKIPQMVRNGMDFFFAVAEVVRSIAIFSTGEVNTPFTSGIALWCYIAEVPHFKTGKLHRAAGVLHR